MNAGRPSRNRGESPLPPRATGIFLGLWMAVLVVLAVFVVPLLFSLCGAPVQ